jgi:hypothetical protein
MVSISSRVVWYLSRLGGVFVEAVDLALSEWLAHGRFVVMLQM